MTENEKFFNVSAEMFSKESLSKLPLIGGLFKNKKRIAVLRLSGVIMDDGLKKKGLNLHRLEQPLAKVFQKKGLEALCLVINCPGGSPTQTALIADAIRFYAERYNEEEGIPVYAFVEDVAASGGYWLACAADEIYVQDSSIVGSIGVISASFGLEDFIARFDIHRRVQTSGKDKSFMDPFLAPKKADTDRLKKIQKDIHVQFIDWVKSRRDTNLAADDKTLFEGEFWTGRDAVDLGLVDGVQGFTRFVQERYGDDVQLIDVSIDKRLPLLGLLGLSAGRKSLDLSDLRKDFSLSEDILETLEKKSVWSRYGL